MTHSRWSLRRSQRGLGQARLCPFGAVGSDRRTEQNATRVEWRDGAIKGHGTTPVTAPAAVLLFSLASPTSLALSARTMRKKAPAVSVSGSVTEVIAVETAPGARP